MMRISLCICAVFAQASVSAQTLLYGLEIPTEIVEQVDREAESLNRDTSLYIKRGVEFRKQKEALEEFEKDEAIRKYRSQAFPQYPPEVVAEERKRNFEFDAARKSPLFNVESKIQDITVDPANPTTYEVIASVGEPTRLVFFDQSGSPWPVLRVEEGMSDRFDVSTISEIPEGNQISIQLQDHFVRGNVLINLQDYGVPLVFRVVADPKITTPYANVRVHRYGPNAQLSFVPEGPMDLSSCKDVYEFMENISVPDSKRNYLEGLSGEVFVTDETTYVRSPYRLVFPNNSCMTSDGNGNYASRIDSAGHHTATFLMEDGEYRTVSILDTRSGAIR